MEWRVRGSMLESGSEGETAMGKLMKMCLGDDAFALENT